MGRRVVEKRRIASIRDGDRGDRFDALAVEEPMEIRVNGDPVAVTMRTPGDDFELALGFCIGERLVTDPRTVVAVRYCAGTDPETGLNTYNVVDVQLRDPTPVAAHLRRQVYVSSSCGICGTASIDAVRKAVAGVADDACTVDLDVLQSLPQRLRAAQKTFERTGGLHAAAVFEPAGDLLCLREDVGRHNAVDKVVGWAATQDRLPLSGRVLMVSGRVAFEIAQKALLARIPFVAAVSAPSSLAVSLAEEAGMTLVGFLRGTSMNVYAGAHRITA